jgi:hypothetical protein
VVESTALEMRRAGNRTVGSNPTLSANDPSITSLPARRSNQSPELGAEIPAKRPFEVLVGAEFAANIRCSGRQSLSAAALTQFHLFTCF